MSTTLKEERIERIRNLTALSETQQAAKDELVRKRTALERSRADPRTITYLFYLDFALSGISRLEMEVVRLQWQTEVAREQLAVALKAAFDALPKGSV